MLDTRFLAGNAKLFEQFQQRFFRTHIENHEEEFTEAKLEERDKRHFRVGESRYMLEPNIKEGKGGLRDLQTLYWIARASYHVKTLKELVERKVLTQEEYRTFTNAQRFLWTVRAHLHYLNDRPSEVLTFDMQRDISARMGYRDRAGMQSVERFMKSYFTTSRNIGNLTRIFCAALEAEHKRTPTLQILINLGRKRSVEGFPLEGQRLTIASEKSLQQHPIDILRLFYVAQQYNIDIHPAALQYISRNLGLVNKELRENLEANALFMQMLTSRNKPGITLRRMNEAGVLGKFIQDFGRIVGQMQYNMYHVHTVDEHTINAISILNNIEQGKLKATLPLATELIKHIQSKHILYLALFLHDIAKGRKEDHSIAGEKIAWKIGPRMGFTQSATETTAWLVRWHLLMSDTAFRRDLGDLTTIHNFVAQVQSIERLRLLLVLTVADIMAVGPTVWNGWKGALLRELYDKAERMMLGTSEEAQSENLHILPIIQQVEQGGVQFATDVHIDKFRSVTRITVCTWNRHGLFATLAGIIATARANIVGAQIQTLDNGLIVDRFLVQTLQGEALTEKHKITRIEKDLKKGLNDPKYLENQISQLKSNHPKRTEAFRVASRIAIDNGLSNQHTVIEITARDRVGLLYTIAKTLSDLQLNIASAHISTYGERAVDVFYIKNKFGLKIEQDSSLQEIKVQLLSALSGLEKS